MKMGMFPCWGHNRLRDLGEVTDTGPIVEVGHAKEVKDLLEFFRGLHPGDGCDLVQVRSKPFNAT